MNKKIPIELAIGVIVIMAVMIGGLIWLGNRQQKRIEMPISSTKDQIKNETEKIGDPNVDKKIESKTSLFYATSQEGMINVNIFDLKNNIILKSKAIKLDDNLGFSSNGVAGANDAVQFNSKTNDIFILTNGASEYDGSCTNKDKTCFNRIYKININELSQKPKILFQTKDFIENWIVDSKEDSIILGINVLGDKIGNEKLTLKTINLSNGETRTISENASVGGSLILSADGKYFFQILDGDKLVLSRIDFFTGNIEKTDIYQGGIGLAEAYVSPNGRFVAFHQSGLEIYDVLNKKMIHHNYFGEVSNVGLLWSGDSGKLIYMLKNKIAYYDIKEDADTVIEQEAGHVYVWAPSNQYIIYESGNKGDIKFYDTFQNKKIEFKQDIFLNSDSYGIDGMDWF